MYTFDIAQGTKADLYRDLIAAVDAITSGEPDAVANMANVAALIWEHVPGLNWSGFYRMADSELEVSPDSIKTRPVKKDEKKKDDE